MPESSKRKTKKQFKRQRHYQLNLQHSKWLLPSWKIQIVVGYTSNKLDFLPANDQEPLWNAVISETRASTRKRALRKADKIINSFAEEGIASVRIIER